MLQIKVISLFIYVSIVVLYLDIKCPYMEVVFKKQILDPYMEVTLQNFKH